MNGRRRSAECKPAGCKLVRVAFTAAYGAISSIEISGDFFIIPEEGVGLIEEALAGCPIDPGAVATRVSNAVRTHGLALAGISPDAIAEAVCRARDADPGT